MNIENKLIAAAEIGDEKAIKTLLANNANINHKNQSGETALMITNKNKFSKIIVLLTLITNNVTVNVKNITNNITNILAKIEDWSDPSKMKNEIITLLKNYQIDLKKSLSILDLKLYQLLQKEFINKLMVAEEEYSLLHIAVLNNWPDLISYLINNWAIKFFKSVNYNLHFYFCNNSLLNFTHYII